MNFDALPLELKLYILSFLSQHELFTTIESVSSEWSALAHHPYLRQEIEIDGCQHFSSEIIDLITIYYRAGTLKLHNVEFWDWISLLPRRRNVRRLEFNNCAFVSVDDVLRKFSDIFPLMCHLDVRLCRTSTNNCIQQVSSWKNNLKTVNLDFHSGIKICKCIGVLADNCRKLEDVGIGRKPHVFDNYSCCVDEESLIKLATLRGAELKKLRLDCFEVTDAGYQSLNLCLQLTHLSLFKVHKMTDSGFSVLKKLNQLQFLTITCASDISECGFVDLFKDNSFFNLQSLHLHNCPNFNDYCLNSVITRCSSLQTLKLCYCSDISDSGLKTVLDCRKLEHLHLVALKAIKGKFLKMIATQLPQLKYINLTQCHLVCNQVLLEIKSTNSWIKIIDCNGCLI